jgi:uncharacterized tellurite resistance protein B-like protein
MWDKIKSAFSSGDHNTNSDALDPKLAAAALLVEAALADGIYAEIEQDIICKAVQKAFALEEADCDALMEQAEQLAEQSVDHYAFTSRIKTLPASQRVALVGSLWDVVFADGEESPFEDAFVRKIVPLLAVNDRDSRFARKEAMQRANITD